MSKITKATLKSFVRNNSENLFVKVSSSFDGMTDCVESVNGTYKKVTINPEKANCSHTLGVSGIWLTNSKNYFSHYEKDGFVGIEVYNCCGCFVVVTRSI